MPQLKIESIQISSHGAEVYSHTFRDGVNVFGGDNSTGKSTIIEFMVYCLGYEEIEWREEQKKCDLVEMVVSLSGKRVRLRREVNSQSQNPMYIKDFDSSGPWNVLPYRNSTNKKSFSSHLFEMLEYPLAKNEQDSSLTMFQILRLIYADQNTSPDSLFNRQKEMDSKGNRRSVYEFIIGADDLEMHSLRQQLIAIEKQYSKTTAEITAIQSFISNLGHDLSAINVNEEIDMRQKKIIALRSQLTEIQYENLNEDDSMSNTLSEIDELRKDRQSHLAQIENLDTEVLDSKELLKLLERSTQEIDESLAFYSVFSGVEFSFCPQCLSKINAIGESHNTGCKLCGSTVDAPDPIRHFYFDRKKEIEFQVVESRDLIIAKEKKINELKRFVLALEEKIKEKKTKINILSHLNSEQARKLSEVSVNIGILMEEISSLNKSINMLNSIDTKKSQSLRLKETAANLREKITQLANESENYQSIFARKLSDVIVGMIKIDGGFEDSFKSAKSALVIYDESKMIVDGATKFAASSDAVLKIATRFALIYLSLTIDRMRIPKFGILDCMEDKGMQEERVHAIQNGILDLLQDTDSKSYQLFFATSMPSQRVIDEQLLVKRYYRKGDHTLEFQKK